MTSPKTVTPDQPQAVPDEAAKLIYAAMLWAREKQPDVKAPAWVEGGNSNAQVEARRVALRIEALAARPVLPVETPAEGLPRKLPVQVYEDVARGLRVFGNFKDPVGEHAGSMDAAEGAWQIIRDGLKNGSA